MARLDEAEQAGARLGASMAELRALPISALWPKAALLIPSVRRLASPRGMGPIVDGWVVQGDDMGNYREGRVCPMPLLVGTTANEGRRLTQRMPMRTAAQVMDYQSSSFGSPDQVPQHYRVCDEATALEKLDEVVGDTQFNYGAWSCAQEMQRIGGQVYRYRFAHPIRGTGLPPTHDDELPYVFGTLACGDLWQGPPSTDAISATDIRLSLAMGDAWTSFARTGNPATASLPDWPCSVDFAMVFSSAPAVEAARAGAGLSSLQQYFGHGERSPLVKKLKEA